MGVPHFGLNIIMDLSLTHTRAFWFSEYIRMLMIQWNFHFILTMYLTEIGVQPKKKIKKSPDMCWCKQQVGQIIRNFSETNKIETLVWKTQNKYFYLRNLFIQQSNQFYEFFMRIYENFLYFINWIYIRSAIFSFSYLFINKQHQKHESNLLL